MALYEIVIGNQGDDTNYSKLILSEEPLNESNAHSVVCIDEAWGEYIVSANIARVLINAWDQDEERNLINIRNQLL